MTQLPLLGSDGSLPTRTIGPFKTQLLKWVGNKQRFAHEILSYFPATFGRYYEPFVGSGAVLGTLAPRRATAGDALRPLVELWQQVAENPGLVARWYADRWGRIQWEGKIKAYEA